MKSLSKMSLWTCASFAAEATLRRMFKYVERETCSVSSEWQGCPTPMSLQLFSRARP